MFTRVLLMFAVVVAVTAGTATAEIVYTPIDPATYDFGIGLYNPADPFTLNEVYVTSGSGAQISDYFQFTFAAHMVSIYYNADLLHFNFVYDNSSLEVVGARPVNPPGTEPWPFNNYEDFQWPNPSSGLVSVSTLQQSFDRNLTNFMPMDTTAIVPFFQVTLHVKSSQPSQVNFFGITNMTLASHTYALTLTPGDFQYYTGAVHEIPEPCSLALLGGGVAVVAGLLIRRRRRR